MMWEKGKVMIIIATSKEMLRKQYSATVEAEYGDVCVEGIKATLAHHGSRSNNPAPCCWDKKLPKLKENDEILISHIDLDTIGGCLALMGCKPECSEFWSAAAYVDVNGPHKIYELNKSQQDMLNAYYAWNAIQPRVPRYTEITDVTDVILAHREIIEKIIRMDPKLVSLGRKWRQEITDVVESKLTYDSRAVRAFETDGVFCSSSYYSPRFKELVPATVSLNTVNKAITIAFADGGKKHSACRIAQQLWGAEAGGRDGIAGSPRGWNVNDNELLFEFEKAIDILENL